jgi:FixJ family two-component response regulator
MPSNCFFARFGHQVEVYASDRAFLNAYTDDRAGCLVLDVPHAGE